MLTRDISDTYWDECSGEINQAHDGNGFHYCTITLRVSSKSLRDKVECLLQNEYTIKIILDFLTRFISFCMRSLNDRDRVFRQWISFAKKRRSCSFWIQKRRLFPGLMAHSLLQTTCSWIMRCKVCSAVSKISFAWETCLAVSCKFGKLGGSAFRVYIEQI